MVPTLGIALGSGHASVLSASAPKAPSPPHLPAPRVGADTTSKAVAGASQGAQRESPSPGSKGDVDAFVAASAKVQTGQREQDGERKAPEAVGFVSEADVVQPVSTPRLARTRTGKISLHPNRRGTQVVLEDLSLFGGGIVQVDTLTLLFKCEKCGTPFDKKLDGTPPNVEPVPWKAWCKCGVLRHAALRGDLGHPRNPSLGFLGA